MKWLTLAWANRARLKELARRLSGTRADPRQWTGADWSRLVVLAAVGTMVGLAAYTGFLARFNPTGWSSAQWAQLVVNLTGFGLLYMAQRAWWNRQDQVWDEVEQLRSQVDELRVALYEHEHDIVEAEGEDGSHLSSVLPVVDRITTEELPELTPTVERELGGRTFSFRA